MKKAKYDWKSPIDFQAVHYIQEQKKQMLEKEDDRLYLVVGETGTGKSMLTFHLLEAYEPNLSMDYIVQERKDFAAALKRVKDQYIAGQRNLYLWFDEADTDNLEQQARWNKKLFAMYMKLRKLAILHFWCFPSLKSIDRRFIEEKVRGVFFCYDKAKDRPRNYCFFSKKAILAMLDEDIRLTIPNLKAARKKYAWWMGYYKDYTGALREAYNQKKVSSMSDAVEDFYEEFSDETPSRKLNANIPSIKEVSIESKYNKEGVYTLTTLAQALKMPYNTIYTRYKNLKMRGLVPPDMDINRPFDKEFANLLCKAGRVKYEIS